jgi:AcrR family transcriptional regulator
MSTSEYHHGNLHEALIEAGLALLHRDGLAGFTLRGAAREAGVSAMAPYRHFPDKDALLAAVAAAGFRQLESVLLAADEAAAPVTALREQGVAYVSFAMANPALFRLMFGAAKPKDVTLDAIGDGAYQVLARRIASLTPAGEAPPDEAEAATLAAWSLVHGLASLIVDGRITPADPAALARAVTARLNFAAG